MQLQGRFRILFAIFPLYVYLLVFVVVAGFGDKPLFSPSKSIACYVTHTDFKLIVSAL